MTMERGLSCITEGVIVERERERQLRARLKDYARMKDRSTANAMIGIFIHVVRECLHAYTCIAGLTRQRRVVAY